MQYIEHCVQLRTYHRPIVRQRWQRIRDANKFYFLHHKPGLTTPQLILVGDVYSTCPLRSSSGDSSKKLPTTPVMEKK